MTFLLNPLRQLGRDLRTQKLRTLLTTLGIVWGTVAVSLLLAFGQAFHFQLKKNAAIAKAYKITGPALIIAKVRSNKVKEYKNLKDIWTKVGKKEDFVSYVRESVQTQMK